VIETSDGGFVVTGWTDSYGSGGYDVLLAKVDSNGNFLWFNTLGDTSDEYGYSVNETSDGGLIVAGSITESFSTPKLLLAKFNSNGKPLWNTILLNVGVDANPLAQTSDGGFVITGSYGNDMLLVKYYSNGTRFWVNTVGLKGYEITGYSVIQTNDGGLVVTGATTNNDYVLVAKFYSNGILDWTQMVAQNNGVGNSVTESSDGGLVVTGWTQSFSAGGNDVLLFKIPNSETTFYCGFKSYDFAAIINTLEEESESLITKAITPFSIWIYPHFATINPTTSGICLIAR